MDDLIGQGAFGDVYKGTNINTGSEVAIKVISISQLESDDQCKRLRREIKILESIKGDNTINLISTAQT